MMRAVDAEIFNPPGVSPVAAILFREDIKKLYPRPWLAEILGVDASGRFARRFINEKFIDYRHSNSKGTRGVVCRWFVDDAGAYELYRRTSWKDSERFFFVFEEGSIKPTTKDQLCRIFAAASV